jgi:hypothetical protein
MQQESNPNSVRVERAGLANEVEMVCEIRQVGEYRIKTGLQYGGLRYLTIERVK